MSKCNIESIYDLKKKLKQLEVLIDNFIRIKNNYFLNMEMDNSQNEDIDNLVQEIKSDTDILLDDKLNQLISSYEKKIDDILNIFEEYNNISPNFRDA